jgi:hypothetical protein
MKVTIVFLLNTEIIIYKTTCVMILNTMTLNTAPNISNLTTKLRTGIHFKLYSLYIHKKSPYCPLGRRLSGLKMTWMRCKRNNPTPAGTDLSSCFGFLTAANTKISLVD